MIPVRPAQQCRPTRHPHLEHVRTGPIIGTFYGVESGRHFREEDTIRVAHGRPDLVYGCAAGEFLRCVRSAHVLNAMAAELKFL